MLDTCYLADPHSQRHLYPALQRIWVLKGSQKVYQRTNLKCKSLLISKLSHTWQGLDHVIKKNNAHFVSHFQPKIAGQMFWIVSIVLSFWMVSIYLFTDQGGINCGVGSPRNFSLFFFGSQDIWVMPVWTDHFRGIPYLGRHLETTYGEKHQRQDRQNWHLNLTFQDTCVTCRAAFTILAMFLCYLYNIFNCIVEHEDNDQLEDHNGEFTEKKCVRGRLDWITLLPLQDSTKGTSTKSLKIQI